MKSTRLALALLALAVIGVAAFLLRPEPPTNADKPVLVVASRLWSLPREKEFVRDQILRPFEAQHNCTVDFQTFDDDALLKRARVQKAAGTVRTDVVIVYVSRMAEWVNDALVQDLTPSAEAWADRTFVQGFADMTRFQGRRCFLPIGADDYLLCANKKALQYLPDSADVQKLTWAQLADWALAVRHGEGTGKFALTGVSQKMLIYQVSCAILAHGGGFPDMASAGAQKAWALFAKMKDAYAPALRSYDSVVPPMKRGEAWLTVTVSARVGDIFGSNPTQFVIAPAPRGPAGIGSVAGVSGFGLVAGAPHRELAVRFLAYMTAPDTQMKLARGTGGFIPTVDETAELLGHTSHDEVIRKSLAVLREGKLAYIPASKDWKSIKLAFDQAFYAMVLDKGAVDAKALKAAQTKINSLLPKTP